MKVIMLCQGSTYVHGATHQVRVGATADGPKFIRKYGLTPADVVVLPGEPWVQGGVGRCAIEFDFWPLLFSKRGFFATGQPLRVVCLPGFESRVMTLLKQAYEGPSLEDVLSLPNSSSEPWYQWQQKLKLRDQAFGSQGKPLNLERIVEVIPAIEQRIDEHGRIIRSARIGQMVIEYEDDETVRIIEGTEQERLSMKVEGGYDFSFPLPVPGISPVGARLAVHTLGCYPGTDPSGGTSCFKVVANGVNYIVDGMAGLQNVLHRLGDGIHGIQAVCLTHCHQDHIWHAIERMLNGEQIRLICAPPVYQSFLTIAGAVVGWDMETVAKLVRWQPIYPGRPVVEYGVQIEAFWVPGPVPTTGFRFIVDDRSLTFSGDTLSSSQMVKLGFTAEEIKEVVDHCLSSTINIVDGGGQGGDPVHGIPMDWMNDALCRNARVVMTHTSLTAAEAQNTAPGRVKIIAEAPPMDTSIAIALAEFARKADIKNGLLHVLFTGGRSLRLDAGEHVDSRSFVVASGSFAVYEGGEKVNVLQAGESFFEMADAKGATIQSDTIIVTDSPAVLVRYPASLTHALFATGVGEQLSRLGELKSLFLRSDQVLLSAEVVEYLAERMAVRHIEPGEMLMTQGTVGDEFSVVRHGRVAVVHHQINGGGQASSTLFGPFGRGFLFGDASLQGNEPAVRTADVIAVEVGECWVGNKATFDGLIELSPGMRYQRINQARTQADQRARAEGKMIEGELTPARVVELLREVVGQ